MDIERIQFAVGASIIAVTREKGINKRTKKTIIDTLREMEEKQIPKAPDWEGCNSFYSDDIEAYCPECDHHFRDDDAYCPSCGQAIDWP